MRPTQLATIGEYTGTPAQRCTPGTWVSSSEITPSLFETYEGLWIGPSAPHTDLDATLWAIQTARESNIPVLGTCAGFQLMALEYVRNVLGQTASAHAEYDPQAPHPLIQPLTCTSFENLLEISILPISNLAKIYGMNHATEHHTCSYGIQPDAVAFDRAGQPRAFELADHPFFVATLFVPQMHSNHPLIAYFTSLFANGEA